MPRTVRPARGRLVRLRRLLDMVRRQLARREVLRRIARLSREEAAAIRERIKQARAMGPRGR